VGDTVGKLIEAHSNVLRSAILEAGFRWIPSPRCLAAFLLLGAFGCGVPDTPSGPPLKLTIAEASQPVFALVYVADARGFLKEAGLDVTFNSFSLGRDALTSVLEGKSDLATVYETPVTQRIYEGRDLAIVSMLHTSARNQGVLARRDRGISGPADLKGKKIGLSLGSGQEYVLSVLLATEGVPPESVTKVQVEPDQYEKLLLGGGIDAVLVFNPLQFSLGRALGERAVMLYSDAYTEASMLVGMREIVAGKRETMTRLLKALVKAQDFVDRNRDEAIRIVAARLAGRFEEAFIREGWNDFAPAAKLDNVLLTTMTLEAQWMKDSGKFSGPTPDFRKAIFVDYMMAVRPGAVTVQTAETAR